MFIPKGSYHFANGCFQKVRKWPKRVKVALMTGLVISSCTLATNLHYTEAQRQTIQAQDTGRHNKFVEFVIQSNPKLSVPQAREIVASTLKMSHKFGVDEKLVLAVTKAESGFQQYAISPTGAYGLMQVIPSWHRDKILKARSSLGNPEIFNVNTNIYLGTWVLSDCLDRNNNKVSKALQCYSGQTPGYDKIVLEQYHNIKKI